MTNPQPWKRTLAGVAAWVCALAMFFPIYWMVVASFKTETAAVSTPPTFVPAAWAMAFFPSKHTKATLLWMLSTKMLPPVGVLVPIYLLFRDWGLLDTRFGLTMVIMLMNLSIVIWMLYTYFREFPKDILESARMEGAGLWQEIVYILLPISLGGIASTVLLTVILAWNESFWSLNLTASEAAPLTAFIASYSSPEGLFWAKLSTASTLAIAPILILGWFSQKQLVRGLTFGAVK